MSNENKKIVILLGVPIASLIICLIVFVGFDVFGAKNAKVEKEMVKLVSEYYKENVVGKVEGVTRQLVTIEILERAGYNVEKLIDPKTKKECDKASYSYVNVKNPKETNPKKIKFVVENHLVCGDYQSVTKS